MLNSIKRGHNYHMAIKYFWAWLNIVSRREEIRIKKIKRESLLCFNIRHKNKFVFFFYWGANMWLLE